MPSCRRPKRSELSREGADTKSAVSDAADIMDAGGIRYMRRGAHLFNELQPAHGARGSCAPDDRLEVLAAIVAKVVHAGGCCGGCCGGEDDDEQRAGRRCFIVKKILIAY